MIAQAPRARSCHGAAVHQRLKLTTPCSCYTGMKTWFYGHSLNPVRLWICLNGGKSLRCAALSLSGTLSANHDDDDGYHPCWTRGCLAALLTYAATNATLEQVQHATNLADSGVH